MCFLGKHIVVPEPRQVALLDVFDHFQLYGLTDLPAAGMDSVAAAFRNQIRLAGDKAVVDVGFAPQQHGIGRHQLLIADDDAAAHRDLRQRHVVFAFVVAHGDG